MIHAVTVSTTHDDPARAGKETADELLDQLGAAPDVVLLFVSPRHACEQVLEGLWRRLPPRTRLIGTSTAGEINGEEAVDGSVTAMGLRLDGIGFETHRLDPPSGSARDAGRAFGARLKGAPPDLLLLFPDGGSGLRVDALLRGIQDELGPELPIIGGGSGGSGDDGSFTRIAQLHQRDVLRGGAVALALRGPLRVATAARSGWIPIGAPRTCTRIEGGNLLLELDGQPALSVYEEYLGPRIADMPAASLEFPLGIVGDHAVAEGGYDGQTLLRTVIGVDAARKALVLAGAMDEGTRVRVTRATKEDVLAAARAAVDAALAELPDPSVALFFNCVSRKIVLGPRYKEELGQAFARLGPRVPAAGFYCFGELSPLRGASAYCQATFTLALVRG